MAGKPRFPEIIHVTRVESENRGESWLNASEDGIDDIEEDGTIVAVYKLVEVGAVSVKKTFQKT